MQRQSFAPLVTIDSPAVLSGVIQLVDPMSEVDTKLATAFLSGPLAKPLFINFCDSYRVSFMRDCNYVWHTITFSNELCRYDGKKDDIIHYAIKGPFIGAGAFCSVYRVTHTLKINRDGAVVCKAKANDKWRAIKIFDKHSAGIIYAKQEYAILSSIPSMHVKPYQYSPVRKTASLLMAYIPGEELAKCLRAHQDASRSLSVLQRLELSRELFAALNQLHQCQVIHRDIKLENIMVSFKPDGSINRVTFIDFNLAKKTGPALNGEDVGTPAYASPEAFANTLQDEKSDIYSLGRVLWCVWGLKYNFNEDFTNVPDFIKYCSSLTSLSFLFKDVESTALSLGQRKKIHDLLFAIHRNSQEERPDAATAIRVFDDVIAEYKAKQRVLQITELGLSPIIGSMRPDTSVCEFASAAITLQDEQTTHLQLPSIHCLQSSPLLFSPAAAAAAAISRPAPAKQAGDNQCVLF